MDSQTIFKYKAQNYMGHVWLSLSEAHLTLQPVYVCSQSERWYVSM